MGPTLMTRLAAVAVLSLCVAGCAQPWWGAGGSGSSEFRVLARVPGWRADLDPTAEPDALLEFVYDRSTAEVAWQQSVLDEPPARADRSSSVGVFGSIEEVDFATEVVAVWSAGQSSSCPAVLEAIDVDRDRAVVDASIDPDADACTADLSPYTIVLVLPADEVPVFEPEETVPLVGADGLARHYPVDGEG